MIEVYFDIQCIAALHHKILFTVEFVKKWVAKSPKKLFNIYRYPPINPTKIKGFYSKNKKKSTWVIEWFCKICEKDDWLLATLFLLILIKENVYSFIGSGGYLAQDYFLTIIAPYFSKEFFKDSYIGEELKKEIDNFVDQYRRGDKIYNWRSDYY